MTERASALGGHLTAGPRPGGGFMVSAWLPALADAEPASTEQASTEPASTEPASTEPAVAP
jgi:hypothetical protein